MTEEMKLSDAFKILADDAEHLEDSERRLAKAYLMSWRKRCINNAMVRDVFRLARMVNERKAFRSNL